MVFFNPTAKTPKDQGVLPGKNLEIAFLLFGIGFEINNQADVFFVKKDIYAPFLAHFTPNFSAGMERHKRWDYMWFLCGMGTSFRHNTDNRQENDASGKTEIPDAFLREKFEGLDDL